LLSAHGAHDDITNLPTDESGILQRSTLLSEFTIASETNFLHQSKVRQVQEHVIACALPTVPPEQLQRGS
jgi:hypothetical protein